MEEFEKGKLYVFCPDKALDNNNSNKSIFSAISSDVLISILVANTEDAVFNLENVESGEHRLNVEDTKFVLDYHQIQLLAIDDCKRCKHGLKVVLGKCHAENTFEEFK